MRNFRDVGGLQAADGLRVRTGVLFRSGHLAGATAQDAVFLASLGLHTVYDFRNAADIKLDGPDIELPGVRQVNIPLNDPADGAEFWKLVRHGDVAQLRSLLADGRAAARMTDSYRRTVLERTAEHGRVVRALADGGVPVLLHCAAGKDRAGVTAAVVLLALGVGYEAIEEDYLKSNAAHRRYRVRRGEGAGGGRSAEVMELLGPLFDARSAYLRTAFDTIEETWGGTGRYLAEGLGVTPEVRERLRGRLLTA
ncbi:tyrosine-protein phosphatase [Streptomyces sp. NPDC047002]|uniref:tyrosine-protein phosphatase n=1 Tax=Streptomyces sp. NPDC047002 TaxID=3155475 RepID=UPI0034524E61